MKINVDRGVNVSAQVPFRALGQGPGSNGITIQKTATPYLNVNARFGLRLKALRSANGLTQAKMATKFGIDRSYISDLERGKKSLTLSLLEVIALGFNVSISKLLSGLDTQVG